MVETIDVTTFEGDTIDVTLFVLILKFYMLSNGPRVESKKKKNH